MDRHAGVRFAVIDEYRRPHAPSAKDGRALRVPIKPCGWRSSVKDVLEPTAEVCGPGLADEIADRRSAHGRPEAVGPRDEDVRLEATVTLTSDPDSVGIQTRLVRERVIEYREDIDLILATEV